MCPGELWVCRQPAEAMEADVARRSRARSRLEAEDVDIEVDECLGGFAGAADGQDPGCSWRFVRHAGDVSDPGFDGVESDGGRCCVIADDDAATRSQG